MLFLRIKFIIMTLSSDIYLTSFSGGVASTLQLSCLYWLRTCIKYQYVYNTSLHHTFLKLYRDSDRFRLYRGFIPTCSKVGLGKIAEAGIISYFKPELSKNNIFEQSIYASSLTSIWKMTLMPLDMLSNSYQVNGIQSSQIVRNKIQKYGYSVLWNGTTIYFGIAQMNYFLWIYTYNNLNLKLPSHIHPDLKNALIGFSASFVADLVVNPFRIIKTYKQSQVDEKNYPEIIKRVFLEEKRFLTGFNSKMLFNCVNSAIYLVIWKRLENYVHPLRNTDRSNTQL